MEEAVGKLEAFAAAGSVALPAPHHWSGRQVSAEQACGGEKVPFSLLPKPALPVLSLVWASSKRKDSKGNTTHCPRAMLTAQLSEC